MSNAFHWKGAPSIFATGKRPHEYTESYVRKNFETSIRRKSKTISLPGGSPYLDPGLMKTKREKK